MIRKIALTLSLLLCVAYVFAQAPAANFTAAVSSGCAPLVVDFQDQSTGNPTQWFWDFGNGATSTLRNPSTTYFNVGVYTVTLRVTNAQGTNMVTRTGYVTVFGRPQVSFRVSDSTGCFPLTARFTDLSTASAGTSNNTWFWDFGDGTQSTQQNPVHVYTAAGNFVVTLKVTNDKGCFSVLTKPNYIRINGGVQSAFTVTPPAECKPPFPITFTNTSTGPATLTYLWDFGDGNTSTAQNPAHTYTSFGNYTVTLTTTSSIGCADTLRSVGAVNVPSVATSVSIPDSICINAPFTLQNTSTPTPVSASWNFGDGNTSTAINPVHTYTTPGLYTIRLTNTYGFCSDTISKTIRALPRPVARFLAPDTIRCQPPFTTRFTDNSLNAVRWQWDFGDGNTSTVQNPTHTYNAYGIYDVRLIVTNSSGCTDTVTMPRLIKVIRPTISFPGLPARGCIPFGNTFTAAITTLDNVTSYLWNFGDGNTSAQQNPSHVYTTQGTYTVSLTITTSTGCTETYSLPGAVQVGRRPVIDFTSSPNPVCAFKPVQFTDRTNEADEWTWLFGDGGSSNVRNPEHTYQDTGRFSVTLIATNNGCRDSLTKPRFQQVKPPIAKFGYNTTCDNRLQFAFSDSSIGATTWLWDFGDGTTSTLQNPTHVFPSYSVYNVTLTVTNDTCSHTITKPVRVINETPDIAASQRVACRVATIGFTAININPANIVDYLWLYGDGSSANAGNPSASTLYSLAGTYTVTLITTDIYGCKDSVVKPNFIRINGPTAGFTASNTSGCIGLTTTFTNTSQGDGVNNIVQWLWDFGDGNRQTLNLGRPVLHTYNRPGSYTVKLIVTDATGCKDSLVVQNLVNTSDPIASFNVDSLSCPGATVSFINTSAATGFTSSWTFGDGGTSTSDNPTHVYNNTGRYTVSLAIMDQFGCPDTLTRPNYIRIDLPVASFTVSDSISSCIPLEVKYTNTSTFYSSAVWSLNGSPSTTPNPTQYYVQPGTYPIKLTVTSPGGCIDSASKTIIVYDTTGTRITYSPLDGCKPLTVNLQAFTTGQLAYTWDLGDGTLINNTSDTLRHIYNFFGDFVPKLILTDPSGCIIPVTGADTIRIIGVTAKFGLDKTFFCDSGRVNFIDSTTYNDTATRFTWNFGDGNTSNIRTPSHEYTSPGIYTVSLNVQTQSGCTDTFSRVNVLKIVASPLIRIGGDTVVCVNDFIQHLGEFRRTDTSQVQWLWRFPNGRTADIEDPAAQQYANAGNFPVTAIAINSSGCRDTATQGILVNPLPVITMPPTITKSTGTPITIPATYTRNVVTYNWSPAASLDCATCPTPVSNTRFTTKYNVAVVDSNGCRNRSEIEVVVTCPGANVFLPNTFSPNGDGSNDVFYVRGRGLERVKSLRIFNRWGEVVFERQNFPANDPASGWDGRYKGKMASPDVYIYQVEVLCENAELIRYEGNVALIQ